MKQVRIDIEDDDGIAYSFPIHCPMWLLWILEQLEV